MIMNYCNGDNMVLLFGRPESILVVEMMVWPKKYGTFYAFFHEQCAPKIFVVPLWSI